MLGSVLNKDYGQFQIRVRANSILGQGQLEAQLEAQLGFKIEFGLAIRRLQFWRFSEWPNDSWPFVGPESCEVVLESVFNMD